MTISSIAERSAGSNGRIPDGECPFPDDDFGFMLFALCVFTHKVQKIQEFGIRIPIHIVPQGNRQDVAGVHLGWFLPPFIKGGIFFNTQVNGKYQKHLGDMPFFHQAPPGSGWIWTIRPEMAGGK
jgi:hypothetical protein